MDLIMARFISHQFHQCENILTFLRAYE